MKTNKNMLMIGALGGSLLMATNSFAASVGFSETTLDVMLGDVFAIDFVMDFSDEPTLGGGTDIWFDSSVLSFMSFDFSTTTLSLDPAFSRQPDVYDGKLEGIAFGEFGGLSGPGIVATLTFEAIGAGNIILSTAATTNFMVGPFVSDVTYAPMNDRISFESTAISVSSVPVPSAVWLFGSGLLGLAGIARRRG